MRYIWLLVLAGCLPQQKVPLAPGQKPTVPVPITEPNIFTGPRDGVINPTNLVIEVEGTSGKVEIGERGKNEVLLKLQTDYAAKWSVIATIKGGTNRNSTNIMLATIPVIQGVGTAYVPNAVGKTMGFIFDMSFEEYNIEDIPTSILIFARDIDYCLEVFNTLYDDGEDKIELVENIKPSNPPSEEACHQPPKEGPFNFDQRMKMFINIEHMKNEARRAEQAEAEKQAGLIRCAAVAGVSDFFNRQITRYGPGSGSGFSKRWFFAEALAAGFDAWQNYNISKNYGVSCN